MMHFFIPLFFSLLSMACEVHLPSHILLLGENCDLSSTAAITDCTPEAVKELNTTLTGVSGKITSFHLHEMLKMKNHDVIIQPQLIQVQHLKHLIHDQMMLPSGVQLRSYEAINSPNVMALSSGDRVEVLCENCAFGAHQPLNVNVVGFDGTTRAITVKAEFRKMVKAFEVTTFRPAFSEISPENIKEVYVEAIPHTELINDSHSLRFFKLNKPLRPGELIKKSDLSGLDLVKAGVKTEVIIENAQIRIKTSGISRSNGSIGQYVEVFHPQKNKKYYGKVVDLNKVLVEL